MAMITLSEYARRNEKDYGNVYRKYRRGDFKTAEKQGDFVMIDENEPYFDKRFVTGRYVGFRKNVEIGKRRKSENSEKI